MTPALRLSILIGAAAVLFLVAAAIVYRLSLTPAERERRRRSLVHREGRMTDGTITDFSDDTLYYQYVVHGVEYAASQDVGFMRDKLPPDLVALVGSVTVKFTPRNPANSTVVSEEWTGLQPWIRRRAVDRESTGEVFQ